MRRILIDALVTPLVIALADGGEIVQVAESDHEDRAAGLDLAFQKLLPLEGIEEIVTITGPGNFSAIRAGLGFARGLALAYGVPSRGVSVFEIDAAFLCARLSQILRDARGGNVYVADIVERKIANVWLQKVDELECSLYWSVDVKSAMPILASQIQRMHVLARLAEEGFGECPAKAFYVRSPDAKPSSAPIPRILQNSLHDL